MFTTPLVFPGFDPVLISIGPLVIRWYALAYIIGLLGGWWLAKRLIADSRLWPAGGAPMQPVDFDDLIVWAALGVVLGGRLGEVLFYSPGYFFSHPAEIFKLWKGGMSFHGGLLGAMLAVWLFARSKDQPWRSYFDVASAIAPIGLFLGRLANFINGELWGRETTVPWGMIFPYAGPLPRHPSQLYQATLEGLVLFALVQFVVRRGGFHRPGLVAGVFGIGYGIARSIGELFRAQDGYVTFLGGELTMGMMLSAPMIIAGLALVLTSHKRSGA